MSALCASSSCERPLNKRISRRFDAKVSLIPMYRFMRPAAHSSTEYTLHLLTHAASCSRFRRASLGRVAAQSQEASNRCLKACCRICFLKRNLVAYGGFDLSSLILCDIEPVFVTSRPMVSAVDTHPDIRRRLPFHTVEVTVAQSPQPLNIRLAEAKRKWVTSAIVRQHPSPKQAMLRWWLLPDGSLGSPFQPR